MNSPAARLALVVIGVIVLVIGGVFAGQGLNLIPGSFMTGDRTWFYIGLAMALVGIILVVAGVSRPRKDRSGR